MGFLSFKIRADNELAKLLAQAVANPFKSAKFLKDARRYFDKAKGYALGSTGKFFRIKMRKAFRKNEFGWKENAQYNTKKFGLVTFKGLIAANKPKPASRRRYIKKPKKRVLGGRLRNAMFHETNDKTGYLAVGVIPDKIEKYGGKRMKSRHRLGWEQALKGFQSAGTVQFGGNDVSMKKYLAAIGMPVRRTTKLRRPARPFISNIKKKYDIRKIYRERFLKKMI